MNKQCTWCKETKDESQFYKTKYHSTGLTSHCRDCHHFFDKAKREKYKANGPTVIKTEKICPRCQQMKPIDAFGIHRNTADGRVSYCKPCWVIITTLAQRKKI